VYLCDMHSLQQEELVYAHACTMQACLHTCNVYLNTQSSFMSVKTVCIIYTSTRASAHTSMQTKANLRQQSHWPKTAVTLSQDSSHTGPRQQSHCPKTAVTLSQDSSHTVPRQQSHCPKTAVTLSQDSSHTVPR
jgi:hypothetical protein